jgi:thiamine-phosphate pyrophosphorylase
LTGTGAAAAPRERVLYFLLDLPRERPLAFLEAFLPRMAGGWEVLDLVQVRAKGVAAAVYVEAVRRVAQALRAGVGRDRPAVLVNDRADVALASGATGVHVGARDIPPEAVRALGPPPGFLVGLTCHTLEELLAAPARNADYVGLGTFHPSPTKPGVSSDPRGVLRRLRPDYPLPVYAIGGLTLGRMRELSNWPALRGVVVSSAIQGDPDPGAAARAWRRALAEL